jgi:hypothetical protein
MKEALSFSETSVLKRATWRSGGNGSSGSISISIGIIIILLLLLVVVVVIHRATIEYATA